MALTQATQALAGSLLELKGKAIELCPLRRADAHQAAQIHDLDGDAFIRALYDTNVVGLALRPVTLFMPLGS